jgi:hypothetical protein
MLANPLVLDTPGHIGLNPLAQQALSPPDLPSLISNKASTNDDGRD